MYNAKVDALSTITAYVRPPLMSMTFTIFHNICVKMFRKSVCFFLRQISNTFEEFISHYA